MTGDNSITPRLLTLVSMNISTPWSMDEVRHLLHGNEEPDDVDDQRFREFFIFHNPSGGLVELSEELVIHLQEHRISYACKGVEITTDRQNASLAVGPYLWQHGALRPICRLYDDTHSAVFTSVIPTQHCDS